MDGYDLTASLVNSATSVAWPVAAFGCFYLVRKELRDLLSKLKSVNVGDNGFSFISDIVEKTTENTVEQLSEQPATVLENLSGLDTQQLKLRVVEFAERLRQWDVVARSRRDEVNYAHNGRENWDEYTQKILDVSNELNHIWRSEYQSTAKALKTELLRRVSDKSVIFSPGVAAIENGILTGICPVSDAAIFLESLARRL